MNPYRAFGTNRIPGVYELQMVGSPGDKYIWEDSSPTRETDNTFYFDGRINYRRVFGNHTVSGMLMYMMREYFNAVLPYRNQRFLRPIHL